jgi:glutamate-1-semialdehyde 2,1-aminomutase
MASSQQVAAPAGPALAYYTERTQRSRELNERAREVMPGGSTRTHGFFSPYPLVVDHGSGPYVWDVDGNRYLDFTYNGLTVVHGYAYEPIQTAIAEALRSGTSWVGTSAPQVSYAEYLCSRVPHAERVRFTSTGTEATMLATKLARHATGRPLILKSWGAYHGSFDDLEAGLYGNPDIPGRTVLAKFGDIESYRAAFAAYGDQIAAVIVEPVLFTFRVVAPPDGFLNELAELARSHGALFILDDCLMFRLAVGGSAERYDFAPDLTCLGKFIGGTLPMGVVAGRRDLLDILNPFVEGSLYHGGSFNGNPLACAAGLVGLQELTGERIDAMNGLGATIRARLGTIAEQHGLRLDITGEGSVIGFIVVDDEGRADPEASAFLHLSAVNRGVYYAPDGNLALCTTFGEEELELALDVLGEAIRETRDWLNS